MKESKRVLITGGAGFIGQSIVKAFEKAGHYVCVFDVKCPTFTHAKCIKSDIFNFEKLANAVKNHDIIIHLVGLADARAAQKEPTKSFELNVASLQNLLEACRINGNKKIVFPSSAAIYGVTKTVPVREDFTPNPTNVYSWHKCMCEKMIHCYHGNFGLKYVILRLFNVYGEGNEGAIKLFLRKAARGETIEGFGLHQYRDFVYAGDVAEVFLKSALYKKVNNKTINVGSGGGTQIKEILDLVCEIHPQTKCIQKKGELTAYDSIADITLAKTLLDYNPHVSREFMRKIITEEMLEEDNR